MAAANVKERLSAQLKGFSKAQKLGMAAAAVAVVASILVMSRWSGKPDMAPLYTNLSSTDAASVTEHLTGQHVNYQLADAGTTILVPRDRLYQLRIDLAAAGLPSDTNNGWSILDKQGLTASEFTQRVGYQRALEGELSKEIASVDAVESATVRLVLPKDDAFALNDTKASASVLVKTRPGKTMDPTKVQAIVNLVASSVQGLTPEAVTVADTAGNVLKAPGSGVADTSAGSTQLQQTDAFETSLASEIQDMLTSVVGAGKATVKVNADLDYDKKQATSETYTDPQSADGQRLAKESSTKTEQYTGAAPQGATGVLGPETTAPTTAAAGTGTDGSNYRLDEDRTSFAMNRVVATTESAPGQIKRLSVAVLVDAAAIDDAQLDGVRQLVSAAAGVSADRGDQVVVSRMPFDTSQSDAAKAELDAVAKQKEQDARQHLLTTIGAVVLVLLVLAIAYRSITRGRRARTVPTLEHFPVPPSEALPRGDDGDDVIELDDDAFVPASALEPVERSEQPALAKAGSRLADMAEQQPEEVAMLLRTWLGDRWAAKR